MIIKTKDLKLGDIMISGEKVVAISHPQTIQSKKVLLVGLRKPDGRERVTDWNYNGTLFVKSR